MFREAVIADYGPTFTGCAIRVGAKIVCVVPPQPNSRPGVMASMRQAVQELGGVCGACRNCPLGNLS